MNAREAGVLDAVDSILESPPVMTPAVADAARRPPLRMPVGVRLIDVEEVEITIERLVAGGEGLGRFEGIPIFVPRSAPGDHLRARLVERRPDYGRAEIVELIAPGPGRRTPPCPYFANCGGCDLQHLEDLYQSELKKLALEETLARVGGIKLPGEVELVTGAPFGYRLRTQLQVRPDPRLPERVEVGYFARGSHDLVPIAACPILVPELDALLPTLPETLDAAPERPSRLDIAAGDGGAITAAPVVSDLPHGEVMFAVDGLELAYDARAFFQGHRGLVPALLERVVGPWTGERAVDLYGGVGLFGLALARRYTNVTAVEGDRVAVRYARANARRNHLALEVIDQAVETWAPTLPPGLDRVVVDPPRAGLAPTVRDALLAAAPQRLTYVSCHPAALARDLRDLGRAFAIESVVVLDLFPQTGHVETVVQLVRREA